MSHVPNQEPQTFLGCRPKALGRLARSAAITLAIGVCGQAQSAIFVDIDGIEGESNSAQYQNTIDAISATGNFNSKGCGVFRVEKELDRASPLLIGAAVSQRYYPEISFIYTRASQFGGEVETFRMRLNSARISKLVSTSSEEQGGRPTEVVSFRARSVDIEYTPVDQRGNPEAPVVESVTCNNVK